TKNPDERYQEAAQFHHALERWLMQHQVAASSATLGAFMREIYAERLRREAEVGLVTADEPEVKDKSLEVVIAPLDPPVLMPPPPRLASSAPEGPTVDDRAPAAVDSADDERPG